MFTDGLLLVRAQSWVELGFGDWLFVVKCKGVEPGRIFSSDKTTLINDDLIGEKVQENILYYVDEGKGKKSHPLFDLFFLCKHKIKILW